MTRPRVILHADMDAFYASVEQRDHPEYRGKPVIVGAVGARGVVSAASYEARVFGVRSAMPGFRAHELCPDGIFVAGDMAKYQKESRKIHEVFALFTDQIEPLALDEAFMDITGSLGIHGEPEEIGRKIKALVRERSELNVSIGIGPNKLLAKIATGRGKPDGLVRIHAHEAEALLADFPVRKLFGIGPKTELRLVEAGILTLGQLAKTELSRLKPILGSASEEMRLRARGLDDRPVVSDGLSKSIGEESTFQTNVSDREVIESALVGHAETVAARARRAGVVGGTVQLKVKLSRRKETAKNALSNADLFPLLSRQLSLPKRTAEGPDLSRAALLLWKKLDLREPVRLLGVTLTDLVEHEPERQLGLFDRPASSPGLLEKPKDELVARSISDEKSRRLSQALDGLNEKFGSVVVRRGASAPEKITHSDRVKAGELVPGAPKPKR